MSRHIGAYRWGNRMEVAKIGTNVVLAYLRSLPETVEAIDVRGNREYQDTDIDIVWRCRKEKETKELGISVKTDTYHWTGNIVLETWSVKEQQKPGGCGIAKQTSYTTMLSLTYYT